MKAALGDYVLLWRMAQTARHAHATTFLRSVAAFAAVAIGYLVYVKTDEAALALGLAARIALGGLAIGNVLYFLPGAIKLNTPANARLVPRMRRRLMELTVAAWAATTGLVALLACNTHFSPSAVFLGTGIWLATIGLARTGHRVGVFAQFIVIPFMMFPVMHGFVRLVMHPPGFAVATLLMFALGAFTLETMFTNGGDRHYTLRKAQALQSERMTQQGQFKTIRPNRFTMRAYLAALRRDSAGHDAGKLLPHLLGAREHWAHQVLTLGAVAMLSGAVLFVLSNVGGDAVRSMLAGRGWLFASGFFVASLFDYERRNIRLMETRGEQALLRLAPVMPADATAFNRTVARSLLRSSIGGWCVLLAAALWVAFAAGASASSLVKQLCLVCLTLPLLGTNLRNHARHAAVLGLGPVLCLAASAGASFGVGALLFHVAGTPLLVGTALTSILIAAVAVPWRWKNSVAAPIAFPVGRLA